MQRKRALDSPLWYKHPGHLEWSEAHYRLPFEMRDRLHDAAKLRQMSFAELHYQVMKAWLEQTGQATSSSCALSDCSPPG